MEIRAEPLPLALLQQRVISLAVLLPRRGPSHLAQQHCYREVEFKADLAAGLFPSCPKPAAAHVLTSPEPRTWATGTMWHSSQASSPSRGLDDQQKLAAEDRRGTVTY